MLSLDECLLSHIPISGKLIIAFSGGLDSTVLLHWVVKHLPLTRLSAVHINHQLHAHADDWQSHCEQTCQAWSVPLETERITLLNRANLEATARELRYAALSRYLARGDYLLTAHHANDQAETFLLQALRGAGPRGLSAMPVMTPFAKGFLVRPMLTVTQQQIQQYAADNHLQWIHDESNQDTRWRRNYLRSEIIPRIASVWPAWQYTLSRSASHSSEQQAIVAEVAAADLASLSTQTTTAIDLNKLAELTLPRQKNVLRYWLQTCQLPLPTTDKLNELLRQMLTSKSDAVPIIAWSGAEVRRYRDLLYAMPPLKPITNTTINWRLRDPLVLSELSYQLTALPGLGGLAIPQDSDVTVRFWQAQGRFHPHLRQHSQTLKKCFQEWGVPPWERRRIPLIYWQDELVAVVGYAFARHLYQADGIAIQTDVEIN